MFYKVNETWIHHYKPADERTCKQAKESKNNSTYRKSNGYSFLGFSLSAYRLSEKRQDHHWGVLHFTAGPMNGAIHAKCSISG